MPWEQKPKTPRELLKENLPTPKAPTPPAIPRIPRVPGHAPPPYKAPKGYKWVWREE